MMKIMKKIRHAYQEFLALPRKNKLGVGLLLSVVFVFAFFVTVFYWRIKTPSPKLPQAVPLVKKQPVPASLSLVPQSQTIRAGESFLVTINFKTGDYKADTVDAVLVFNPEVLAVEKISEGMFFADYPITKIGEGKVILTGTIGAEEKQPGGAKGEGALASISFRALTTGVADVNFDKTASLVAVQGENVLGETKGAVFEIY